MGFFMGFNQTTKQKMKQNGGLMAINCGYGGLMVFFFGVLNGETWSNGKFKKQKYVGFPLDFMRIFNGI